MCRVLERVNDIVTIDYVGAVKSVISVSGFFSKLQSSMPHFEKFDDTFFFGLFSRTGSEMILRVLSTHLPYS